MKSGSEKTLNCEYIAKFIEEMKPLDSMTTHMTKLQDDLMARDGGYGEEILTASFILDACSDICDGRRNKDQVLDQLTKSTGYISERTTKSGFGGGYSQNYKPRQEGRIK